MTTKAQNIPPAENTVKDLAEGFSLQARLSNRLWLALFTVLAFMVLPVVGPIEGSSVDIRRLPFGFGEVGTRHFDLLSFFLLCVLTISYCSARSAAMISYDLAHRAIDQLGEEKDAVVSQRQYFDMLSHPTLLRVGPISVLSKRRFGNRKVVSLITSALYFIIKHVAIIITFGMPLYAIYVSYSSIAQNSNVHLVTLIVATIFGALTILAILQVFLSDLRLSGGVFKRLSNRHS